MCKKKQFKYCPSEIDECMEFMLVHLEWALDKKKIEIVACCCGHDKYPKTIVVRKKSNGTIFELLTGMLITRKKKFYKKDDVGYYYIPEVSNPKERKKSWLDTKIDIKPLLKDCSHSS